MRVLYYNCPAGLSGDMNLGAMLALGVEQDALERELRKLGLDGWELVVHQESRQGISGTRCKVLVNGEADGGDHGHSHAHGDAHEPGHHHDAPHHHHHHHDDTHHHHHRSFREIREMIEGSSLEPAVKADAIAAFRALAEAEAAVHGTSVDAVHFHEVGAVDSIIDMVGAAVCWHLLGIDLIAASTVELGGGTVRCAHGIMPVPAPATARLIEGMPVSMNATDKETTTPTGAALLRGKQCTFAPQLSGRQLATGIGIGGRDDPNLANVLYATLYETGEASATEVETVTEIACNIDDMTAEQVAFICERLFDIGALDVWQTAATFKKGRSGIVLNLLCSEAATGTIGAFLVEHTSTLGIRMHPVRRTLLNRRIETRDTQWGPVRYKVAMWSGGSKIKPEYEDCSQIARTHGLPIQRVSEMLVHAYQETT